MSVWQNFEAGLFLFFTDDLFEMLGIFTSTIHVG
jgi:hypothetical protein